MCLYNINVICTASAASYKVICSSSWCAFSVLSSSAHGAAAPLLPVLLAALEPEVGAERIEPSDQWGISEACCFAIGQYSASERRVFACVGWLVGWEDEIPPPLSIPPPPPLALWLGPVSRFCCGAGGSVYVGGWWQRSGRANGPVKSGGGRRGEARTADQEHIGLH